MSRKHAADDSTPDDTPDPLTDEAVEAAAAESTDGADPTVTAREGVSMPEEPGTDDDPGSFVNP